MTCNNVDYQFTKVPTKLFMCLDCNCRSVLFTLIQLSMLADEQGWFFRSNADLEAETKLSRKVIDGVLDALLRNGLIDFIPQQQGQGVKQTSRLYYVNFNSFLEYEKISIDDCIKNPKYQILTSDYKNGTFTWKGREWANKQASLSLTSTLPISPSSPPVSPQHQSIVPTSIDTIDNKENINIKNNKLLNINSLNNSIISIENSSAEHSTRSSETIESPSNSFVDGLELNDEAEIHYPSSCNSSSLHDGCLRYIYRKTPNEMNEVEAYEFWLANALFRLVRMDAGELTKEDELFYNARKTYMELYGIADSKQATKDINFLKAKVKKMREDYKKSVA